MKVALCLFKYFPFGGLQRDFFQIAQELISRGHSVRVYVQSWEGDEDKSKMDVVLVNNFSYTNHKRGEEYFGWVQNHLKSHPVDLVVGFNRMPGLDIYYGADVCYAEKNKQKNIFYKLTPRYKHYMKFERATVGKGLQTKILVLNNKQKEEYQRVYKTEDSRFVLIPPGISKDRKYSELSESMRCQCRDSLELKNSDFCILQIGSDFYRKGVDRSIRALASLPLGLRKDCFLCVVGQDNPKKFITLAHELGVENQVKFLGGRKDVPHLIAASDIFIHPARSECAGIAILEALIGGVPEIVTEVCGYASYVKEADSGLVLPEPYDQKKMDKSLLYALERSKLKHWRENACMYADTHDLYSLSEYVANIIESEYVNRQRTLCDRVEK